MNKIEFYFCNFSIQFVCVCILEGYADTFSEEWARN